jgi:hypothetical protein
MGFRRPHSLLPRGIHRARLGSDTSNSALHTFKARKRAKLRPNACHQNPREGLRRSSQN